MATDRLKNVEDEIKALRRRVAELEAAQGASVEAAPAPADSSEWFTEAAPEGEAPSAPAPVVERDLESQIGARVVAIVGLVVLVLGAVFFLNLAFTRGWIGLAARIYLGIAVGFGLWGLGGFLHWARGLSHYGQVVSAAGASIVYLAVFVGHQVTRYQVATGILPKVGLVLVGLVALGVVLDAGFRRAPWFASLSMPLMAITVVAANEWIAFTVPYVVLLTAAVLGASVWRTWPIVALASVPSSFLTLLIALYVLDVSAMLVLVGTLVLLALHTAVGVRAPPHPITAAGQAAAWLGAWGLVLVCVERLVNEAWLDLSWGLWTLGLSLGALALVLLRPASGLARWVWAVTGLVLFLAWPPLLFDGTPITWIWLGTLAALFLVDQVAAGRVGNGVPAEMAIRQVALIVGVMVAVRAVFQDAPALQSDEITLGEGIPLFLLLIGVQCMGWLLPRRRSSEQEPPEQMHLALAILPALAFLWAVLSGPGVSLAWAGIAVVLITVGFVSHGTDLRVAGLAVLAVVLGRIVFVDLADVDAVWRVLTFIGFGAILLGVAYAYTRLRKPRASEAEAA